MRSIYRWRSPWCPTRWCFGHAVGAALGVVAFGRYLPRNGNEALDGVAMASGLLGAERQPP